MSSGVLGLFFGDEKRITISEYLDNAPFDELVDIDVANNRCRNIFHVEGKYFVPVFDGSYRDLYRYAAEHMIHPDDKDIHLELMDPDTVLERLAASATPGVLTGQFRYKLQDGGWRWVEQVIITGPEHGVPDGTVRMYTFDIQNVKDHEAGNFTTPYYDAREDRDKLTRLYREKAFFAQARKLVENGEAEGWCLIAIDILHFQLFNEWYGREAGDFLLAEIGGRLTKTKEEFGGLAGFLGQDDFCILMPFDRELIVALYDDFNALIADQGALIGFTAIFGISMVDRSVAILDLYDRALIAAEKAKEDSKQHIRLFESTMHEDAEKEYRILSGFRKALEDGEFYFQLQPQCRISTGKIVGVEVLARWRKPDGTMISPGEFVPVLEKFGFIVDLDLYIWDIACASLKAWIDAGRKAVPLSVNVSQADMYQIDVADELGRIVEKHGLPPELVKVEVTESAYAGGASAVRDTIRRLRDSGFTVLMDDFGSGYSSLNMLRNLDVDVIKLDTALIDIDGDESRKGVRILESTVNMAKTMQMPIIVEGVETEEQARFLSRLGCRYVQGYHFYRPMDRADFEALIEDGTLIDPDGFSVKANDEFRLREFLDDNVYSDAMLNSILGPVAIYSWGEGGVNITRFNEQFYEVVNDPQFNERLTDIQRFMPEDSARLTEELLRSASENQLTGSTGILKSRRADGSLIHLLVHFFFIKEASDGMRFYGSVRDVTEIARLHSEMEIISRFSTDTIVFIRKTETAGGFDPHVMIHGLEDAMGLTYSELQLEMRNGGFYSRIDPEEAKRLRAFVHEAANSSRAMSTDFRMANPRGEIIRIHMKIGPVEDDVRGISHALVFQKKE